MQNIKCPKCGFEPPKASYWICDKCGTMFDTFETKAHCPNKKCDTSWTWTQCPCCGEKSDHIEWYVKK